VPQVFSKEAEQATGNTLREQSFKAVVKKNVQLFKGIDFQTAPNLLGYVATKPKETSEILLEAPERKDPLLARWQYGLGKTAVFASDLKDRWAVDWLRAYHRWLEQVQHRGSRNLLWQFSRKRVAQVIVGMLFVTGLVGFSGQLLGMVEDWLGEGRIAPDVLQLGLWITLTLVGLAPLVAIWRNLSAMALIYSEISTRGHPYAERVRPVIETALKFGFTGSANAVGSLDMNGKNQTVGSIESVTTGGHFIRNANANALSTLTINGNASTSFAAGQIGNTAVSADNIALIKNGNKTKNPKIGGSTAVRVAADCQTDSNRCPVVLQ
jgi:hypothetical protein